MLRLKLGVPVFNYFLSGDKIVTYEEVMNQNIGGPNIQYVQAEVHAPFEGRVLEVPVAKQEFLCADPEPSQNQMTWQGLPVEALAQDPLTLCWEPSVQLKEPVVKEAIASELDLLTKLQKFDRSDWMNIPFFETQKAHRATPGFCALKTNPELKPFDTSVTHQSEFENTLAAITHAAITQINAVQERLQGIVNWCNSGANLSPESVTEKIKELFINDKEFLKTNDDILQLSCGKRASIIQHKRFNIISKCSNSVVVEKLKEIPPSNTHLFDNTQLQKVLLGGFTQKIPDSKHHHQSATHKPKPNKRKHYQSFRGNFDNRQKKEGLSPAGHESRKRQQDYSNRAAFNDSKRRRYK
ncbi:NADPH-dependent FMN reductase [Operophtera brumata]|uniref:NADPH-dependent FMN reductase n=1 Tax=Operophtera brumata TaxID=104452 RepID=A0A0L7K462_OPEBR|nr:NADPH-dependent FMN reductase [Operophtera brumata]